MTRVVLLVAFVAALLLPASPVGAFPSDQLPDDTVFGYDEAAAMAARFDAAFDAVPEDLKVGITSLAELQQWTNEIVPFFEYENVVLPSLSVYPTSLRFEYYGDGLSHNHILGTTNCFSNAVVLNARIANPTSAWYARDDSLGTLVHELAHAQGICIDDRLDSETSAQLVTLEVLAAMTNYGNERAFAALVSELREMAVRAAKVAAIREERLDEYDELERTLFPDPFDQARRAKADRFWAADREKQTYIYDAYNYQPIKELYLALISDQEIEGVSLPINFYCKFPPTPSYTGQSDETFVPCEGEPLVVDDLAYVFDNLEPLTAAVGAAS